ncbi:MAG: DUF6328 family protein [Solirubrobacterales bacterium]
MARRPREVQQRLDRELIELLNELRVALPGVQVLFAFLLTVPFTQRFATVTEFQREVYFATLLLTTAACVLLIAPSAYHRLSFRGGAKEHIILDGNRLTLAGLAVLAMAMTGVVLLISDVLFKAPTTLIATAGTGLLFAGVWWALPLARNRAS